jgi:hypothetical protein
MGHWSKDKKDGADKPEMRGPVKVPPLGIAGAHPVARAWYRSLAESGQSRYYEPSDWQMARIVAAQLSDYLSSGKLSANMLAAFNDAFDRLLVTEGSRRRLRIEVQRIDGQADDEPGESPTVRKLADYRHALDSG